MVRAFSFFVFFFFSSRRRHTRSVSDWSSDVCSSDLTEQPTAVQDQYFSIDPLKPIISKALLPFIHRSIPENAHCARKDSGFAQNRPLTRRRLRTEVRSYLNTPGCVTVGLW